MKIILILIFLFYLYPQQILGAELFLDPAEGNFKIGEEIKIEVKVNSLEESVNAFQINLNFPSEIKA